MKILHNNQIMIAETQHQLSFCTVTNRGDSIAIIEIFEGVEVDTEMAQELADLANKLVGDKPFGLLSNRKNSYSLSFPAMEAISKQQSMIALAVVLHNDKSRLLIETQNFFISHMKKKPVKIFTNMDAGIHWLKTELENNAIESTP